MTIMRRIRLLLLSSLSLPFLGQCLQLSADPVVSLEAPTIVTWTRDNFDLNSIVFDLRFTQKKQDVGLALAGVVMQPGQLTDTVSVQFEEKGLYTLVAVVTNGDSPQPEQIAESRPIAVLSGFGGTSSILSATSSAMSRSIATNTSSSSPSSKPTDTNRGPNIGAIIGGILGGLVLVALLGAVLLLLRQRHRTARRRVTFHREMMLAHKEPDEDGPPTLHSKSLMYSSKTTSRTSMEDLESNISPKTPLMMEIGDNASNSHAATTVINHSYNNAFIPPHATTGYGSSSTAPQTSTE